MATTIDQRIVEMKFDNRQFEQNVSTSMGTLDKLKQALKFDGASKGLQEISGSVKGFDASPMTNAVEGIKVKFSALQVAGMTAVAELTKSCINAGKSIANSTIGQIFSGGKQRTVNLENAKFQIEGLGLDWEKLKQDMDYAVDGTAYGLDQAAIVCSQIATTGVEAGEDMKQALRAVSGLAAITNRDYSEIGRIFTTVAGQGKVTGDTLNQVGLRGVDLASKLGEMLGKSSAEIKQMVSKGEIDFATFAKCMDDAFGEHAKDANKTFNGALSNIKSALSRIGAEWFAPLRRQMIQPMNDLRVCINNVKNSLSSLFTVEKDGVTTFGPLERTFSKLSEEVSSFFKQFQFTDGDGNNIVGMYEPIKKAADAFGEFLDNDGVIHIFNSLLNIATTLVLVFKNLKGAFTDIFPRKSAKELADMMGKFELFTEKMSSNNKVFANLRTSFSNIFQSIKNLFTAVSKIGESIGNAFRNVYSPIKITGDGLVTVTGFIKDLTEKLIPGKKGVETLTKVFEVLFNILGIVGKGFGALFTIVKSLSGVFGAVTNIFSGFVSIVSNGFAGITDAIKNTDLFTSVTEKLSEVFDNLKEKLTAVGDWFSNFKIGGKGKKGVFDDVNTSGEKTAGILDKIKSALSNLASVFSNFKIGGKDGGDGVFDEVNTSGEKTIGILDRIKTALSNLSSTISGFISKFTGKKSNNEGEETDIFSLLISKIKEFISLVKNKLSSIKLPNLQKFFEGINAKTILDIANGLVRLFAALLVSKDLRSLINNLSISFGGFNDMLKGFIGDFANIPKTINTSISSLFGDLKKSVDSFSKGETIKQFKKIAEGLVLLAAAMLVISKIDSEKLIGSLGGITTLLIEALGSIKVMSKFSKFDDSLRTAINSLITLSVVLLLMASAVKKLGKLDSDELGRGLLGITGVLSIMTGFMVILPASDELVDGLGRVGKQMILMAAALILLAIPIKMLGKIDNDELGRGLLGIAGALTLIGGFMMVMPAGDELVEGLGRVGKQMILLALALTILVIPIKSLGKMDSAELGQGLLAIAGILTEIWAFVALMTAVDKLADGLADVSKQLLVFSVGITLMAFAISQMGGIDPDELKQGLGALGAIFGEILIFVGVMSKIGKDSSKIMSTSAQIISMAVSLTMITNAIAAIAKLKPLELVGSTLAIGAVLTELVVAINFLGKADTKGVASILLISAALLVLAPALKILGSMELSQVGVALLALIGTLAAFGVAALVLTPVVPVMIALAGALALLGVAVGAAGVGIALIGAGLTAIGAALVTIGATGEKGLDILLNGIKRLATDLITMIPEMAASLVEAIVVFAQLIVEKGPVIGEAIGELVKLLVQIFTENIPDLLVAAGELLSSLLQLIVEKTPEIVEAFMDILIGFLEAIAEKIPEIAEAATDIIVAFINAVQESHNRIINAAVDAMIAFINGLADTVETRGPQIRAAIKRLFNSIINEAKALITDTGVPKIIKAGKDFIMGFIDGIKGKIQDAVDSVKEVGRKVIGGLKDVLGIASPSKEAWALADYFLLGWVKRVRKGASELYGESEDLGKSILDGVSDNLNSDEMRPVITPVLDLSEIQNGSKEINKLADSWDIGTINGSDQYVRNASNAVLNAREARNATLSDNSLSSLKDVISKLNGANTTNNNTFNISGDNPREIADEVSRILQMQVERKQAVWG